MKSHWMKSQWLFCLSIIGVMLAFEPLHSEEPYQKIGPSTGLPIPRYISLNSSEAYMRRGPSTNYPVEWVYKRDDFPLRVIGESGHWRKVEDADGYSGWFHYALLSGKRTVFVTEESVELRKDPAQNAQISAVLQHGVIADLLACTVDWCEVEVEDNKGWLPKSSFWGADAQEVFEEN